VEGEIRFTPHYIQVLTDDDELEMAYYFFDDEFLAKHRDRAALLLHDAWELPTGELDAGFKLRTKTSRLLPNGTEEGATYLVFLAYYDSLNLTDIEGGYRFDGVRLPELCRHLAQTTPEGDWPFELRLLRSQVLGNKADHDPREAGFLDALAERINDTATWAAYSDWLEEHGQLPGGVTILRRALARCSQYPVATICNSINTSAAGRGPIAQAQQEMDGLTAQLRRAGNHEPSRSLIQVAGHVAQLGLHTDRWRETDLYHRWILFDDLWAIAQPALAEAVLCHASRWDVLPSR
jgi:uncharacterized protein (TIGR02996 family)